MLLRLEECIKVPERALNEVIGWHFSESAEGAEIKVQGIEASTRVTVYVDTGQI